MARRGSFGGGYRDRSSSLASYLKSFIQNQLSYEDNLMDYQFSEGQISDKDYLDHLNQRKTSYGGQKQLQYTKKYNTAYYNIQSNKINNLYTRGLIDERDVYKFENSQMKRFEKGTNEWTQQQTNVASWKQRADTKQRSLYRAKVLNDISAGRAGKQDKLAMLQNLYQQAAKDGDELSMLRIETEYNNAAKAGGGGYGSGTKASTTIAKQISSQIKSYQNALKVAEGRGDLKTIAKLLNTSPANIDEATWGKLSSSKQESINNMLNRVSQKNGFYANVLARPDLYNGVQQADGSIKFIKTDYMGKEGIGGSKYGIPNAVMGTGKYGQSVWLKPQTQTETNTGGVLGGVGGFLQQYGGNPILGGAGALLSKLSGKGERKTTSVTVPSRFKNLAQVKQGDIRLEQTPEGWASGGAVQGVGTQGLIQVPTTATTDEQEAAAAYGIPLQAFLADFDSATRQKMVSRFKESEKSGGRNTTKLGGKAYSAYETYGGYNQTKRFSGVGIKDVVKESLALPKKVGGGIKKAGGAVKKFLNPQRDWKKVLKKKESWSGGKLGPKQDIKGYQKWKKTYQNIIRKIGGQAKFIKPYTAPKQNFGQKVKSGFGKLWGLIKRTRG